jgi:hypothetical protein
MARSTAFDKLRVAHELARRPIVAEAFRAGTISYSAARAITRIDRPDPAVDDALVTLAQSGEASITDLERAVRCYRLYAEQDRPPPDDVARTRDVKILRGEDGTGQVVVTLGDLELEEFAATLQAFLDRQYRPQAVDQSSGEDASAVEAPLEEPARSAKKADAFIDLARTALAHVGDGHAGGGDRYMVHVVTESGSPAMTTLDGRPLRPADAQRVTCDSAIVGHSRSEGGEPLYLGRKTRVWSVAQRRAIAVRDGGHCRFPGCHFSHYDIHHIAAWEHWGPTDIDNGCCQCPRHHHMLHNGYRVEGDPNVELRFYRADGSYLGATHPASGGRLMTAEYADRTLAGAPVLG